MPEVTNRRWVRRERDAGTDRSAAAGVWFAAVVRLAAAGAQLASDFLRHATRVPGVRKHARIRVVLDGQGWSSPPVALASSFRARWTGIGEEQAILLRTRSVHTLGQRRPIAVTELDETGRVLANRIMHPGRFVTRRAPRWFLETALEVPLPPIEALLTPRRLHR